MLLFTYILTCLTWPILWSIYKIAPLLKPSKDRFLSGSYRLIHLLVRTSQVLCRMLEKRLRALFRISSFNEVFSRVDHVPNVYS